jgi:alcohol dehydrogenase
MRAMVYHGPGRRAWEEALDPEITDDGDIRTGDTVAVIGAGPIGLSAVTGTRLNSPSHIAAVCLADTRLEAAKDFGADITMHKGREDPLKVIRNLTGGLGADVTIEAADLPATFALAVKLARPGGRIANIGVHGQPATLHLEKEWSKNITITTGLVDTYSTLILMCLVASRQIDARKLITHRFGFDQFPEAYDVFAGTGALKVVMTR